MHTHGGPTALIENRSVDRSPYVIVELKALPSKVLPVSALVEPLMLQA